MSTLLEVSGLTKRFPVAGGAVHAVTDISFSIEEGESLGLVGESGSGKTTTGRCILRLVEPTAGTVRFRGRDVTALGRRELRAARADMQVVFQEPYESLNPRMSVERIVEEHLLLHRPDLSRADRAVRVAELLDKVSLRSEHGRRRPHELSGGQQQRVGIARAIATDPAFVGLVEPTSSLDVSVRAQILELLLGLQRDQGLSYLFISHDLATIQYSCARVAVMYLGRIVEIGPTEQIFGDPRHPYTRALLSALLRPDVDQARGRIHLEGEIPSAITLPPGCAFASRCPIAQPVCTEAVPELRAVGGRDAAGGDAHRVACLRAADVPALMAGAAAGVP